MSILLIKILLQIALIVAYGYLSLAFFQRLFCKDLVTYNYKKFLSEKGRIWKRFKIAIKLKNYQIIIGLFILCMVGFCTCLYEINTDWQLVHKSAMWQLWGLAFTYAVYESQANMKLKIFYDLAGRDPKDTLLKQQPSIVISRINKELDKILSHKKAMRLMIGLIIILASYGFYSSYSQYKLSGEAAKYLKESKNYKAEKDSLLIVHENYKKAEKNKIASLEAIIQSLNQRKISLIKSREEELNTPIDYYSDEVERMAIYNQMVKETK